MATFDEPQSRIEAILQNMLGANNTLLPPMSRNEALLLELLRQGSVTEEEIAKKLAAPVNASGEPIYGTSGQILQTNGDGTTQWTDGGGGGSTTPLEVTTWAALIAKRDAGTLTPGMQYRITDYVCTTTQDESRAVSHPFDIIVTADDESTLNENARAVKKDGDTYYQYADLSAWELKYCIDNDATRFAWADTTNGKGVIYWLKDDRGNECPYDFKQIQFKRYKITECTVASLIGKYTALAHGEAIAAIDESNPVWCFTFSAYDPEAAEAVFEDASVAVMDENAGCIVYENVVSAFRYFTDGEDEYGPYIYYLPDNVFANTFYGYCHSNTFGTDCFSNTFDNNCSSNIFGSYSSRNTFGSSCSSNTFDNNCSSNIFGDGCQCNTFGNNCSSNTFGGYCGNNAFDDECTSNTFGNNCSSNTFGGYCGNNAFDDECISNTFGNNCSSNIFGSYSSRNTFGSSCSRNTFGVGCQVNTFDSLCDRNVINTDNTMYYHVLSGVSRQTLATTATNNFVTYVGKNSSGVLKTWVPADLVQ